MDTVAFEPVARGHFRVSGRLGFETAAEALEASRGLFSEHPQLVMDLGGVTGTDSAGLALLVEWIACAKRAGCKLTFRHIPEQALALARISEVDKLLPGA